MSPSCNACSAAGCHPVDGCQDGDGFGGANYPILAANVVSKRTRLPILLPFTIKKVGGVPVGFVGMTLKGTPSIVNPAGITTVDFLDEATTANTYAKRAAPARGQVPGAAAPRRRCRRRHRPDPSTCAGFSGAVTGIVSQLDPAYGVVVSGHTHRSYVCQLPNSSGVPTPS